MSFHLQLHGTRCSNDVDYFDIAVDGDKAPDVDTCNHDAVVFDCGFGTCHPVPKMKEDNVELKVVNCANCSVGRDHLKVLTLPSILTTVFPDRVLVPLSHVDALFHDYCTNPPVFVSVPHTIDLRQKYFHISQQF